MSETCESHANQNVRCMRFMTVFGAHLTVKSPGDLQPIPKFPSVLVFEFGPSRMSGVLQQNAALHIGQIRNQMRKLADMVWSDL